MLNQPCLAVIQAGRRCLADWFAFREGAAGFALDGWGLIVEIGRDRLERVGHTCCARNRYRDGFILLSETPLAATKS